MPAFYKNFRVLHRLIVAPPTLPLALVFHSSFQIKVYILFVIIAIDKRFIRAIISQKRARNMSGLS